MQNWRYWGDLNYWRWRWRHGGPNARALPVLLAALGCGVVGYLIAGGVSEPDMPGGGALTIVRTVRVAGNSSTATPPARTVRVVSRETIVRTATEGTVRTVASGVQAPAAAQRVVTTSVPTVRRVVVTRAVDGPPRVSTVTTEHTTVKTQTTTVARTDTVTRTETVNSPPVTQTIAAPPLVRTTTVTTPLLIVTVTVPIFP